MYLYETHCHNKHSSACAVNSADETVKFYLANGYTGIFVTDHFINGNATVNYEKPNAPYEEKVEAFFLGYEKIKKAAKKRLQVFFGLEYSYKGTDVLAYGLKKEDLLKMPIEARTNMNVFIEYARAKGALTVQAHPFREAGYIDHIRLFPKVDGVETYNANRTELCNRLGELYATEYEKIKIGGTDYHGGNQRMLSGMAFEEKLQSEEDFVARLKNGEGEIVKKANALFIF